MSHTFILVLNYILMLSLLISTTDSLGVVVDIANCENGCRRFWDCPKNSECTLINRMKHCGICTCLYGYQYLDGRCVSATHTSRSTSTLAQLTTTTVTETIPTRANKQFVGESTVQVVSESTVTNVGQTTPIPDYCANYTCKDSSCKNTPVYQPKPCANIKGNAICESGTCFNVRENYNYCICPGDRIGFSCADTKAIACEQSDNRIDDADVQFDKRWRSVGDPDSGSIVGRHFATDVTECVRLCKWATPSV